MLLFSLPGLWTAQKLPPLLVLFGQLEFVRQQNQNGGGQKGYEQQDNPS